MNKPLLPVHILEEIKGNPAFEHVFLETVKEDEVVQAFNRMNNTSLNFKVEMPKSALDAMIFKSTGWNGLSINNEDFAKFLIFVHDHVYLPMVNEFNKHEALNN